MKATLYSLRSEIIDMQLGQTVITLRSEVPPPMMLAPTEDEMHMLINKQMIHRHVTIQRWDSEGQDVYLALDEPVKRLVTFLFDAERESLYTVISDRTRQYATLELKVAVAKDRFNMLPWYKRILLALRKQVL